MIISIFPSFKNLFHRDCKSCYYYCSCVCLTNVKKGKSRSFVQQNSCYTEMYLFFFIILFLLLANAKQLV